MSFYFIALGLFAIAIFIYSRQNHRFPMLLFILYGVTACFLGLFYTSQLNWLFSMRYFLYVVSGFVAGFIPLLLGLIIILLIFQLYRTRKHYIENMITIIIFTGFIGVMLWILLHNNQTQWVFVITSLMYITMYYIFLFVSFVLLSLLIGGWSYFKSPKTLIILGQRIEGRQMTHNLRLRLRRALKIEADDYLVTGGAHQTGEKSEANYMADYLNAHGVPSKHLFIESRALNTKDNFRYSADVIKKHHLQPPYQVVTSFSHIFRAQLYAWSQGLSVSVRPARDSFWTWPYDLVREFIAILILSRHLNVIALLLTLLQVYFEMRLVQG